MTGRRFERLLVIVRYDSDKRGKARWFCRCDCGKETIVCGDKLRNGSTKSCGCYLADIRPRLHVTHGMSKYRVYRIWHKIRERCYKKKDKIYPLYGGRGIKMCERWKIFENFLKDMGFPPTNHHSIDRIDTNGNYEPSNCRWATAIEQQNNRRNNVRLTHKGETKTMAEWSRIYGIRMATLSQRIKKNWPVSDALETPPDPKCQARLRK